MRRILNGVPVVRLVTSAATAGGFFERRVVADYPFLASDLQTALFNGLVIPAHPLALTKNRRFDERSQRALTRYYHASGAGGVAVAVHTTQFAIRRPEHGLLQPVLNLASETLAACDRESGRRTLRIAGVCGETSQAVAETTLARDLGYDLVLVSLAALSTATEAELVLHCDRVARELPIMGFYLQPTVGGRVLSLRFWQALCGIPNVAAIKIAPFNRYQTLDVVRAVVAAGRERDIALYTGNDDQIVMDLLSEYAIQRGGEEIRVGMAGGLLGHWACWTSRVPELLERCRSARAAGSAPGGLLTLGTQVTDCNAAFFDAANQFRGCIAGINEVLRRQGLIESSLCLDPAEVLSPGQSDELDRVRSACPELSDDAFVREHIDEWRR